MPDSGIDLGADLYRLWQAGTRDVPWLAWVFASANNDLADTDAGLASAFTRSPGLLTEMYGYVYGPWTQLRNQLQRIMADMATNLEGAADALVLAANQFADTDSIAAKEFTRLKGTDHDSPPASLPTAKYPPAGGLTLPSQPSGGGTFPRPT